MENGGVWHALSYPLAWALHTVNRSDAKFKGVSSLNDYSTNNTRVLVRKTCILLYFIHGSPVFSILGHRAPAVHDDAQRLAAEAHHRLRHQLGQCAHAVLDNALARRSHSEGRAGKGGRARPAERGAAGCFVFRIVRGDGGTVREGTAILTVIDFTTTVESHLLADLGTPGTLRIWCRVCVSAE